MANETRAFKKLVTLFKDYQSFEVQLNKEYDNYTASGKYSQSFLSEVANKHRKQLAAERTTLNRRMKEVRAEFQKQMEDRNDITKHQPNVFLALLLQALPSDTTAAEFKMIMETKGRNALSKRMIADCAAKHGFKMYAGLTTEEALAKFDQMAELVNKSLSGDTVLRAFLNPEEAMSTAMKFTAEVDEPKISCIKDIKAHDFAEADREKTDRK